MPTYEYRCLMCSHQFEAFQSIAAKPLTECPKCGNKVQRLIGGGMGIIFKGSGFYCTDSRRSQTASAAVKEGENKKTDTTTSAVKETAKAAS